MNAKQWYQRSTWGPITMADEMKRRRELEIKVLDEVGDVISVIKGAKYVDEVICALHSFAIRLFPLDSSLLSGAIDHLYRDQVCGAKAPSSNERNDWWQAFYRGAAFPTLARVLLFDVASDWLACFPFSARKHVYDVFFVSGLYTEVVQTLVPCLLQNGTDALDVNSLHSNAERLLVLCLIENDGVLQMAREFGVSCNSRDLVNERVKQSVSSVAQTVASIPDKARLKAPPSLSSHLFFKRIIIQLLPQAGGEMNVLDEAAIFNKNNVDCTLVFVGEMFARICRRGSADLLLSELTPRVLKHVRSVLLSNVGSVAIDVFESTPDSLCWLKLMESIRDPYVVERISEQLLHQLANEHASDTEAYWILWVLFNRIVNNQASVRSMFVDKFLLWKVFPVCSLRWIIQFAVLECPPDVDSVAKGHNTRNLVDMVQRLAAVWSKQEFVQVAPMDQQAYITAAVGLSLEKMSKEDLDVTKDVMASILQGVSCRLESPTHLVRKMASSIALVFSKVIDPKNPLYLDDSCTEETVDWEFGLTSPQKGILSTSNSTEKNIDETQSSAVSVAENGFNHIADKGTGKSVKNKSKRVSEFKFVDPDEIIDPAMLNSESASDIDYDDASEYSDTSSDSSLQPYDLTDDDADLKRKFSQLVDVVAALRKSDDADGVEGALDVAENLVRASPDELMHVAGDLVRSLVQIRCSDIAIEGEEESAEEKRHRALVALIVMSPIQSLDTLNKLLYSLTVDVSQRIMILDVMTVAAQELSEAKTMKPKHQPRPIISVTSETQPWFLPSSIGPTGASPWKEISSTGSETLLSWSNCYERELPSKPDQIKNGKTRRWSVKSSNRQPNQSDMSHNKFPIFAAAFMLPAMQGFDKKRQGVDFLGRDFIVLGKLIYMLGICMKCTAMHPEASALTPPLLDMLRSREVCNHKEAYVRKAVLFTASCILLSLHPSYVSSSLIEGNLDLSQGLEWIRTWALHIAESDTDRECYTMAMACLQLHAEMALQATRALESTNSTFKEMNIGIPSNLSKGVIQIPSSNIKY